MKSLKIWSLLICLPVFILGGLTAATCYAGTMDLIGTLVDTLGITKQQAKGGTGALFKNAKDNLSAEDFKKVSDSIPNIGDYLAAAPAVKPSSGLGGALGSTLMSSLGSKGKAGTLGSLTSAFSNLGMDSGTLAKFIPIVLEYVQSTGGQTVMELLKGLWQ